MEALLEAIWSGTVREELESYRMRHAGEAPNFSHLVLEGSRSASFLSLFVYRASAPVDFSWCDLRGAKFLGCNLKRARFVGADLRGADFTGANLQGADFTGANLEGATFGKAMLIDAKFVSSNATNAKFVSASMERCDLTDTNFHRAILTGACLNYAQLTGARFTEAALTGASLYRCLAEEVTFTDADFRRANVTFFPAKKGVLRVTQLLDVKNLESASLFKVIWFGESETYNVAEARTLGYVYMSHRPKS